MSGTPASSGSADDFQRRLSQAMKKSQAGEAQTPAPAAAEQAQAEPGAAEQDESAETQSTGPVGTGDHIVREGECISSIAKNTGHFWKTIWNDAANAELQQIRQDPNVLLVKDKVYVPPLRRKEEPGATEMRHRFRRLGEPAKLRLRILEEPLPPPSQQSPPPESSSGDEKVSESADPEIPRSEREDKPRAGVPYILDVEGTHQTGETDAEGRIECEIPGNARKGRLTLEPGTERETTLTLRLGATDPLSELRGVKERLTNLGFDCGEINDEPTPELRAALEQFQEKYKLKITGEPDQATRKKLRELHES